MNECEDRGWQMERALNIWNRRGFITSGPKLTYFCGHASVLIISGSSGSQTNRNYKDTTENVVVQRVKQPQQLTEFVSNPLSITS